MLKITLLERVELLQEKKICKIMCTKKIGENHQVMVKIFNESRSMSIEYREKRLCSVDTKTTMVFVHVHREGCRTCWKQVGLVSKKKPIHLLELRAIVKSMNESDHENSKIYYDAMY